MTAITLKFDFNWKLTLSVLFVFPALIRLSFWQLERADEKKTLTEQWKTQQAAVALPFSADNPYSRYDRVFASGRFVNDKYWLKENQMYRGQLGYAVIMPFQLNNGEHIIVDRGWVKGSPNRDFVPQISTPAEDIVLTGSLVEPSDSALIDETLAEVMAWPHKILEVDLDIMAQQSGAPYFDKILRVDADSPASLVVYWRPINSSPAKHYGYAVQWALLACALLILYVFASSNLSQWLKARK